MAKKNLPIKLFQKRQKIDDRRVEGGGNDSIPKWELSGQLLAERAESFIEPINELIEVFQKRNTSRSFIPATLKIDIDDNAIAKSHRKDIQKIFNGKVTKNNIIGFLDSNSAIVKVDSIEEGLQIKNNIANFLKNPRGISAIESIEVFKPFILDIEENQTVKISLIDFLNYEINNAVKIAFIKYCNEFGIEVKEVNYSPAQTGVLLLPVKGLQLLCR